MFKRYLAAVAALILAAAIPAQADYVVKDGAGASQTFGSFNLSGVQFPKHVMVDPTTGAAIGVSSAPLYATLSPNGLGAITATPACSTNGTPLASSPPTGKRGARLYVPPGGSISFTVAAAQPSSAPLAITVANPSTNTIPANWDEDLAGAQMVYCTASSGSPLFRWY